MKKFYKSSLITAGILFATGSIILIICTFAGGSSFYHNIRSGNIPGIVSQLSAASLDTDDSAFHINDRIIHCNFNRNYPVYSGSRTDKEAADAGKVQKINIDLGGGEFMIEKSSDQTCFEVVAEGKDKYQYYTEEGTLYIIGFDGSNINFGDRHNKLTLRIPANLKFADVYVSLGAGNIKWDYLTTDSITIDAGAGSITMTDVSAASANVDLGAGSIEFYDSTLQDASFEVGLGTLDYSGVIRGDLSADCGMGNLNFDLTDSEKKHNYSLDVSMGSISIGDREYKGMAYEQTINNETSSNYDLSCSMGDITITFED